MPASTHARKALLSLLIHCFAYLARPAVALDRMQKGVMECSAGHTDSPETGHEVDEECKDVHELGKVGCPGRNGDTQERDLSWGSR